MQGIYFTGYKRPTSKKAIKDAAKNGEKIIIQATGISGGEYDGLASEMPEGMSVTFVGPDPFNKRNFYGKITKRNGTLKVE